MKPPPISASSALGFRNRCRRRWPLLPAVFGLLLSVVLPAQSQTTGAAAPPQAAAAPTPYEEGRDAMWHGDFQRLQALYTRFSQPGQVSAAGGSNLTDFRRGIISILACPDHAREECLQQMVALTAQWTGQHPKSPLAHVLYARALSALAWWHRGEGFANSVTPAGWRAFSSHIQQALDHLVRHAEVVGGSSSTHHVLLDLGRSASWPKERLWAVYEAGVTLNPHDDGIYRSMLTSLQTRWGGDAALTDRLVEDAVRRTQATRGDYYYARMYLWVMNDDLRHRLFDESRVNWPRLRSAMRELLQRHPNERDRNHFARLACMASDKPTAREALALVGEAPALDAWGARARREFDACQRWAQEP